MVGFTVYDTALYPTVFAISMNKEFLPHVKVVLGGPSMSLDYCQTHLLKEFKAGLIDVAVLKEGEITLVELVKKWRVDENINEVTGLLMPKQGSIVSTGSRILANLNETPMPDFSDLNLNNYRYKAIPTLMSKGCVAQCIFCSEVTYWERFRFRDTDLILEEIKNHVAEYNINHVMFLDSLINGHHRHLEELVGLILDDGLKISFNGNARVSNRLTKSLIEQMSAAGCSDLVFGLESGSQKVSDLMKKGIKLEWADENFKDCFKNNIGVILNIIIGYPGESEEDFQQTLDLIDRYKKCITHVNVGNGLAIYKGMSLYPIAAKLGVASDEQGEVIFDENENWSMADGSSDINTRRLRISRLRNFLASKNMNYS